MNTLACQPIRIHPAHLVENTICRLRGGKVNEILLRMRFSGFFADFRYSRRVNYGYAMICNYSPAGNVPGQPVNQFGKPCSSCPDDRPSCSRVMTGLCGRGKQQQLYYTFIAQLTRDYCFFRAYFVKFPTGSRCWIRTTSTSSGGFALSLSLGAWESPYF